MDLMMRSGQPVLLSFTLTERSICHRPEQGDPSHDFKFQRNSLLDLENENATIEVLRYGRPDIVHTYQWCAPILPYVSI